MGYQMSPPRHRGPALPTTGNTDRASRLHRTAATILVCLAAVVCAAAPVRAQTNKYALLIGINDYQKSYAIPNLRFARADAQALEAILVDRGFSVQVLTSNQATTRNFIVSELNRYARQLGPDDYFVLFFAGHGARRENNGQTYWLAYDADVQELDVNGIRLDHLLDYVNDIPARNKLVLLDHCYAGDVNLSAPAAVAGGGGSRGPGDDERGLDRGVFRVDDVKAELKKERNLTVIAGARDEAYEDSTLGHGVFTKALIEALGDGKADGVRGGQLDDRVDVSELIEYTRSRVFTIADTTRLHAQGLVQEVISYSVFENAADFEVITLSAENISQDDIEHYKEALATWAGEGILAPPVMVACMLALTKKSEGSPLSETELRILESIRGYVEWAEEGDRDSVGASLNVVVNGLLRDQ